MPETLKHLSTTLIGNWALCPERAYRSYLRRLEFGDDNEGTDATRFGTAVHNTMEWAHNRVMTGQVLEDDDVMRYFNNQFAVSQCLDFEYFSLGQDKLLEFLKRSIYNRRGETIAAELTFVYCVETKEVWLSSDVKFDLMALVEALIEEGYTPVISKIDRIDKVGPTSYEIFDYKTNILPFTREEIESSKQLGLYDLVLRAIHPDATSVTCIYDMVRHGRFSVEFNDDFRDTMGSFLTTLWNQIRLADKLEQRLNKYCRWCEIRSGCKTYKEALASDLPPVLTENTDTEEGLSALYDEMNRLGDLNKAVEQRMSELKEMFAAKITRDSFGEPLRVGGREFYLQPNPRYEYDKKQVWAILRDANASALIVDVTGGISKTAMDRFLKARPEFKPTLGPLLQKKFVTPSVKSRVVKGIKSSHEESEDAQD